jgi:hypothetical protein
MAQYSILLSKKGTILSLKVADSDAKKIPVKKLTGRHFSHLIGSDCKKDLRNIIQETSKSRKPGSFRTFFAARGSFEGPVVDWIIQPRSNNFLNILMPARYMLIGVVPE